MDSVRITIHNIEDYRGSLNLRSGDLPFEMWQVFDREAFDACGRNAIVPIEKIASTKNELLDSKLVAGKKDDPRQTAFKWMTASARGQNQKRKPITVYESEGGTFLVEDGNATVQVLMLSGWTEVPVELLGRIP